VDFLGRVSWNILQGNTPIIAFVKSERLYCVREKENGYKQFVVENSLGNNFLKIFREFDYIG